MKSYNYYLKKKSEKQKGEDQSKVYFYTEMTGSDFFYSNNRDATMYDNEIANNTIARYDAFRDQQDNQFIIFTYKDSKYGRGNIFGNDEITYTEEQTLEAHRGLYFRMRDKLNRYKILIEQEALGQIDNEETIFDTLNDLSNYANIAIMVKNKTW